MVAIPTRAFEMEKLVCVILVAAIFSIESRSCLDPAASRASFNYISVSSGLYLGVVFSLVTL